MKRINKAWLSCWLYVIVLISGIIIGALIIKWNDWSWETRLFALATALLPIHVLEEWRFPGGFHVMYNLMKNSDISMIDRYPMNQLSDMWTNFIGVIFGVAVLFIGVRPLFCMMQIFLCLAELYGHISGGLYSYKRFKAQGKKTIYSPGLFTTIFGYLPIMVGLIVALCLERPPQLYEYLIVLPCSLALGIIALPLTEKLCKSKDSPYAYDWGDGYFDKFLK
jgi:hypothetical protein